MTPAWLLLYNSQSRKSYSPCYNSAFPGHETLMEKVFSTVWVKSPPPHNLNTCSHSSKKLFITLGALSAHCKCFLCAAFCRTLTRIFIPESIKKKKKKAIWAFGRQGGSFPFSIYGHLGRGRFWLGVKRTLKTEKHSLRQLTSDFDISETQIDLLLHFIFHYIGRIIKRFMKSIKCGKSEIYNLKILKYLQYSMLVIHHYYVVFCYLK